jgi:hypothetical protein
VGLQKSLEEVDTYRRLDHLIIYRRKVEGPLLGHGNLSPYHGRTDTSLSRVEVLRHDLNLFDAYSIICHEIGATERRSKAGCVHPISVFHACSSQENGERKDTVSKKNGERQDTANKKSHRAGIHDAQV